MSSGAPSQFIHLRVHTEFSLVNGLVRIKALAGKVSENAIPAIAITDQSNLCAYVKFFKAVRGAGAKPILGADIYLENEEDE
ncbi:PHP domain-containing protein, partial [Oleiphilus sp. HI0080]